MTSTSTDAEARAAAELVSVRIDDTELSVPKGTLVIRAAETVGVQIPRFCDHPLLAPVGACRQCLVEVEGQRKPVASCTTPVTEGMVVRTQHSSAAAAAAQTGVMELLLINHPLDCPICDKGGECPLQNQAMSNGRPQSRFVDTKRTFRKPVPITEQVLLDRERCVLCARCTRFADQVAGDRFIELLERGAQQQVGVYPGETGLGVTAGASGESYFSGNTVQICPVGALTSVSYRFRARPFDLVSAPSVCEHCASGCDMRTDHRRDTVLRRPAGDDPDVNEEWNCDKGRWAFTYADQSDRITTPLIRRDGVLEPASWSEALRAAADGLGPARGRAGVLVGGRVTLADAYTYAAFARIALGTNDIDFRIRAHSAEEEAFLGARVAGRERHTDYRDLEQAPVVVLVAFEPEEESPIVFLRLRKAARGGVPMYSIAPFTSRGLAKLSGTLLPTIPGDEARVLTSPPEQLMDLLRRPGAVIMVGERLAGVPAGFTAVTRLADATNARLVWVPRRAGDRGALDAGALPTLLPGGHPVADAHARNTVARAWQVEHLPATPGRDTNGILAAAAAGELSALLIGGVELDDLPDPVAARAVLAATRHVVSLELRRSAVTEHAHVVFPVASAMEKPGTFVNWEGRHRPFPAALPNTGNLSDQRVLTALAAALHRELNVGDPESAHAQLRELGTWTGPRVSVHGDPVSLPKPAAGEAILASWRMLLDLGRGQDGEGHLAATARRPVACLSSTTAAEVGVAAGELIALSTARGTLRLPVEVSNLPDRVVWVPLNSPGSTVYPTLAATAGSTVSLSRVEDHAGGER